jgi:hypothetical protein
MDHYVRTGMTIGFLCDWLCSAWSFYGVTRFDGELAKSHSPRWEMIQSRDETLLDRIVL